MELIILAIKDIFRRKAKNLYLLVSIVIPVAILSTILLTFDNAGSSLSNLASKFGFSLIVQPKNVRMDKINQIGINTQEYISEEVIADAERIIRETIRNPEEAVIAVARLYQEEEILIGSSKVWSVFAGIDFQKELEARPFNLTGGRWPANDQEAVLGGSYARAHEVWLSDGIMIRGNEFTIVGILENYNSPEDHMVFAPFSVVQRIFDKMGLISIVNFQNISLDKDQDLLMEAVVNLNENLTNIMALSPQQFSTMKYSLLRNSFQFLMTIVVATIAVSIFSIFNIVTSAMYSRVNEIGLLKSVGASRSQLLKLFLSVYLLIGLLGGLIGYLLSLFMAYLLDSFLLELGAGLNVNLLNILVAVLVGVFCSLVASFYPTCRLSGIKITETFRTQWEG
jgi:putative ABC transport system permease protein